MFLQITLIEAMMNMKYMTNHPHQALFNRFTALKNTLNPNTLTLELLRDVGVDEALLYQDIDAFHADYLRYRLDEFSHQRKVDMNEHDYNKSFFQKLWMIFRPIMDFFQHLDPRWTAYYLSKDALRLHIETLFSQDQAEFILVSRYIELSQTQKLIHSQKDSDELSSDLHQALLELIGTWSTQGGNLIDDFKPIFIAILDAKENLD